MKILKKGKSAVEKILRKLHKPRLKRYLAFSGGRYYPEGGMYDFAGDFDSLERAIFAMNAVEAVISWKTPSQKWDNRWAHIWDSVERKEAWSNPVIELKS